MVHSTRAVTATIEDMVLALATIQTAKSMKELGLLTDELEEANSGSTMEAGMLDSS